MFQDTKSLKEDPRPLRHSGDTIALLFFEPSTRTRMSFETASHRIGVQPIYFDAAAGSSLEKGETIEDSIRNIAAMLPKAVVVRCADDLDLYAIAEKVKVPVINAGWGIKGHPTQALLDTYTLWETFPKLSGKKLLMIGDIRHSRVAASHFELASKTGIEIRVCGPQEFLPNNHNIKSFSELSEGLAWADVVMALRVQFERHQESAFANEQYHRKFGLNAESLKALSANALIFHPGPINHGIEMEFNVLEDPRCRVFDQVTNGVFVRESILRAVLGERT
jgi:aspartate carbamoyltransferase catalytic subunit